MKTDARIRQAVEEALRWTPDIKFGSIAVAAQDGAVMLHGAVARWRGIWPDSPPNVRPCRFSV